MRFFFKIFFTTLFIAVTCTAAAGYVLIRDNVDSLLDSDTARAVESGSIAAYALSAAAPDDADQVAETASTMNVTYGGETLRFLLLDESGEPVYSSLGEAYLPKLAALRDPEHLTWQLSEIGGVVHVLALRPALLADGIYYVGTAQSVAHVFQTQLRQYQLLLKILAVTVVAGGAVTLLVSKFLTRKLRAVVQASNGIAEGDLQCRAMVRGSDEFGSLAFQFNRMADTLSEKIEALEEENERRTLFTGAFAHELRTPLTSIIGYADLLRRQAVDERTSLCAEYILIGGPPSGETVHAPAGADCAAAAAIAARNGAGRCLFPSNGRSGRRQRGTARSGRGTSGAADGAVADAHGFPQPPGQCQEGLAAGWRGDADGTAAGRRLCGDGAGSGPRYGSNRAPEDPTPLLPHRSFSFHGPGRRRAGACHLR